MKDLGTEKLPIRASHLPTLIACPFKLTMIYTTPQHLDKGDTVDEAGQAAQTGSMVHRMIDNWYNGKNYLDFNKEKYPKGDLIDAQKLFNFYQRDPRNQPRPTLVEKEFQITLDPHPLDKTKKRIHIWGHLDQVRPFGHTGLAVWDVKSTRYPGFQSLCSYITQIAAYTLGARKILQTNDVRLGGLILVRQYNEYERKPEREPLGVFYQYASGSQNIDLIMEPVRLKVALIRAGHIEATPNSTCTYCFAGGPDSCLDILQQINTERLKPKTKASKTPMELGNIL